MAYGCKWKGEYRVQTCFAFFVNFLFEGIRRWKCIGAYGLLWTQVFVCMVFNIKFTLSLDYYVSNTIEVVHGNWQIPIVYVTALIFLIFLFFFSLRIFCSFCVLAFMSSVLVVLHFFMIALCPPVLCVHTA